MDLFTTLDVIGTGLTAQRARLNAIASNLSNSQSTRTAEGGPYRRLDPVFQARPLSETFPALLDDKLASQIRSVEVVEIRADPTPPREVYDPRHPDADTRGYVGYPNVRLVEEMVNLITASRAYEANISAMQAVQGMARKALSIGR